MKKCLGLIALTFIFCSCENTWDGEMRDAYKQTCIDEATWATSEEQKNDYCDCVLERTMEKYPKVSDALEHMQDIANDPHIRACRSEYENSDKY